MAMNGRWLRVCRPRSAPAWRACMRRTAAKARIASPHSGDDANARSGLSDGNPRRRRRARPAGSTGSSSCGRRRARASARQCCKSRPRDALAADGPDAWRNGGCGRRPPRFRRCPAFRESSRRSRRPRRRSRRYSRCRSPAASDWRATSAAARRRKPCGIVRTLIEFARRTAASSSDSIVLVVGLSPRG